MYIVIRFPSSRLKLSVTASWLDIVLVVPLRYAMNHCYVKCFFFWCLADNGYTCFGFPCSVHAFANKNLCA